MKYTFDKFNDELCITYDDGDTERISQRAIQALRRIDLIEWGKSITVNHVSKKVIDRLVDYDYEAIAEYLEDLVMSNNGEREEQAIRFILGDEAMDEE